MGNQPEGRLAYERVGVIIIWTNKRLKVLREDDTLYVHFRGPNFTDHRIIIDQQTGAATAPNELPRNQDIVITVQVGDAAPVENRIR